MNMITCFIPYIADRQMLRTMDALHTHPSVKRIFLLADHTPNAEDVPPYATIVTIDRPTSSQTLQLIARHAEGEEYLLLYTATRPFELGYRALERLCDYIEPNEVMAYADAYHEIKGERKPHPLIDYQTGSVRDDFDFGSLLLFRTTSFCQAAGQLSDTLYSALYELRLILSRERLPLHIREYLYTETEADTRRADEKQFDYVDPRNRAVQIEREEVFTRHLRAIGAWLPAPQQTTKACDDEGFPCEASVIIPVRNRVSTIDDAICSVLGQETDFSFNLIVVDNYSTDGTREIIERHTADPRVIHLTPDRTDLGIGGCWSYAACHPACGRYAVQLDSDDLYSTPHTLQRIIDTFHREHCAMVIGTYRMTDFHLNTLPPGIIDHREWTDRNGHNNALRVNGLGAPRAFYTPLLRQIGAPNTSYGEDYALGLAFSRRYRIGRIYDVLYLCRRWTGNSDASLTLEKQNRNNAYKDSLRTREIKLRQALHRAIPNTLTGDDFICKQLKKWELARHNFEALSHVQARTFSIAGCHILVQFNPARAISTCAKLDSASLATRPCFLCAEHTPPEQESLPIELDETFELRLNPYPILPGHLTLSSRKHQPQCLADKTHRQLPGRLLQWLSNHFAEGYTVFYNGAHCGASAPDHFHFQAVRKDDVPFIRQWNQLMEQAEELCCDTLPDGSWCRSYRINGYLCPIRAFISEGGNRVSERLVTDYLRNLPAHEGESEPRYNLFVWHDDVRGFITAYFPRTAHRPACYTATDGTQMLISPGALDMGGILITPRQEDFRKITDEDILRIFGEVSLFD